MADVLSHPNESWDWERLSENPGITMDDVIQFSDKPWCWECVSGNPNITIEDVRKHLDKPWNWWCLSRNLFGWHRDTTNARCRHADVLLELRFLPAMYSKVGFWLSGGELYRQQLDDLLAFLA